MLKYVLAAAVAGLALASAAHAAPDPERSRTVAGVQAVEAHWLKAFLSGDEAYMRALFDPAYVSVNQKGVARPTADIVALSKKIAAGPPMTLPPRPPSHIEVHSDAAVVTSTSDADTSVDVFYWAGGRWHAWYSQHTAVKAAS
jgi:hypothetical protein